MFSCSAPYIFVWPSAVYAILSYDFYRKTHYPPHMHINIPNMNKHWAERKKCVYCEIQVLSRARYIQLCVCVCPIAHFRSSLSAFCCQLPHVIFFCVRFLEARHTHTYTHTPTSPTHLHPDSMDGGFEGARDPPTHTATMKIKFYRPRCVYSACFAYFIGKQQPPYVSFSRSHSFARTHTAGRGRAGVSTDSACYFARRPTTILFQIRKNAIYWDNICCLLNGLRFGATIASDFVATLQQNFWSKLFLDICNITDGNTTNKPTFISSANERQIPSAQ